MRQNSRCRLLLGECGILAINPSLGGCPPGAGGEALVKAVGKLDAPGADISFGVWIYPNQHGGTVFNLLINLLIFGQNFRAVERDINPFGTRNKFFNQA